jgi:hypothetical protein
MPNVPFLLYSRLPPPDFDIRSKDFSAQCSFGILRVFWCTGIPGRPRMRETSFEMKFKRHSDSPLKKKARRGFRGFPVATIAFYGPDDQRASKVAVGIVEKQDAKPVLKRWFTEDSDARTDPAMANEIVEFVRDQGVVSVVMTDRIIGCPHEKGIDYPDDEVCPQCPFWAHRNRWTGEIEQ